MRKRHLIAHSILGASALATLFASSRPALADCSCSGLPGDPSASVTPSSCGTARCGPDRKLWSCESTPVRLPLPCRPNKGGTSSCSGPPEWKGTLKGCSPVAELGVDLGDTDEAGPEPLQTSAGSIFCDLAMIGASWVRVAADRPDVTPATYANVVHTAHTRGLRVLLVVPARYAGRDDDQPSIDAFTAAYVAHLQSLTTTLFTGSAQADAFEIGNEPNACDNTVTGVGGAPDSGSCSASQRYRVGPNAFAWLLRRVGEWRASSGRTETIVSGGIRDTHVDDAYWKAFLGSTAFTSAPGPRPFDFFGVHPYDARVVSRLSKLQ